MSRQGFTLDACFGMPGVPNEPGCCKLVDKGLPTEHFEHPWTEATYQVWLRGYKSMALAVRDKMAQLIKPESDGDDYTTAGGVEKGEIGLLLQEWQEEGFIPKRPGD